MNWKIKAFVQTVVSLLPDRAGYWTYYRIQRYLGALRRADPTEKIQAGIEMVSRAEQEGRSVKGSAVLEVGTGWGLTVPIALALCGADRIYTVDLNPYLKKELVFRDLRFMGASRSTIDTLFGRRSESKMFRERFALLMQACDSGNLSSVLDAARVTYWSPCDAGRIPLGDDSIDIHVSLNVLEHIPPDSLLRLFSEGLRVLKPDGLFIHRVDFTDHFSHSDRGISSINFLRFDDRQWDRYAGNRFMYHNRLRVDDLLAIMKRAGLKIHAVDSEVDLEAADLIDGGFDLSDRFRSKATLVNATAKTWVSALRREPGAI